MSFLIRKLDLTGIETFAYTGTVLRRAPNAIVVEAIFERVDRLELGYTVFERGDRFVEYFYADRWFNIFAIYAVRSRALRGWYCNLTRPAVIEADRVSAVDLALDVWVSPTGEIQVLDEDEFAALALAPEEVARVWAAVDELRRMVEQGDEPFGK